MISAPSNSTFIHPITAFMYTPSSFNAARDKKKFFWLVIFFANLAAIFFLWMTGSSYQLAHPTGGNMYVALGRLSGLLLEYAILLQLVLIGRMTFIEEAFGFDQMNNVHRYIGYSLAILLLAHPLFLALGYGAMNNLSVIGQISNFFATWQDVFDAFIGMVLFLYVAAVSIPVVRRKLDYELWHFIHLLAYVSVALAFGHQINSGDAAKGVALYYWIMLNFGIFGLLLGYRFLKPVYQAWYFGFTVSGVEQETPDTYSVYITGRNLDTFHYRAGQYANISFLQKSLWPIHPFSFSIEENGEYIRFTIKGLGDFTKLIPTLRVGTRVLIEGPHGRFTPEVATKEKILCIGGGVGITPLRAMIGSETRKGNHMTLLYGVRTVNDIAFRSEFDAMGKEGLLTIHYITSATTEGYESGYVDQEKLARLVPDFYDRDIFVCGPPPMMDSTIALLERIGVAKAHIHFEKFSF